MTARYYPVSLSLEGRRAVVIADGDLAAVKTRALLDVGAIVTVITSHPVRDVTALHAEGRIELRARPYQRGDLDGAYIAIACPTDRALNSAIFSEAEERRVLLNAVDDVEHCHFIAPALVQRGPVTVAISTSGASPALAVRLRQLIERVVRPEHGRLAQLLGGMRGDIANRVPDLERRKELWFAAVDSSAVHALKRGNDREARIIVDRAVTRATTGARERKQGFVTLVGAGPGRPGLITVEGLRALRKADVVLYDRLVHPALLRAAPAHAQRAFVGKSPRGASMPQEWINDSLVSLANDGLNVVRLKGGDPFVFGRGAEECAALRAAGIPHRVIPGISSAIAAPGAAGIPVTHREVSSAFVVVSGEQAASATPLDWEGIARIPTIVVMMGVAQLPVVIDRLRSHGVTGDTPAAVIAAATRGDERRVVGTVATIAVLVERASIEPPATLIVGGVVRVPFPAHTPLTAVAANGEVR